MSPASLRLIVEPRDGVRPIVKALNLAQRTIFLSAYILSDRSVIRALERAAAEQVSVFVLLEPHPFGLVSQPLRVAGELEAAGIHVRWSRSGFTYSHAKYIVIDDRVAILGTANFSASAFTGNREFLVEDPLPDDVAAVSEIFRADWDRLRPRYRDARLVVSPNDARAQLTALLASARRSIDVYAEEIADPPLERLMAKKVSRHVGVRVLLPPGATPFDARKMALAGVHVRGLAAPYAHAKAIVVDGSRGFIGSENVSSTSLDRNREVGIVLGGRIIRQIDRFFSADWAHGTPIHPDRLRPRALGSGHSP